MESENLIVAVEPDVESQKPTIPELNAAVLSEARKPFGCARAFYLASLITLICVSVFLMIACATEMPMMVIYIIFCVILVLWIGVFLLESHLKVVEQRNNDIEKTVALGYYPVLETSTPGVPVDSDSA